MQLNLPILEQLAGCKHLLIAGMGGGFDIFCGLPIYFDLQARGQDVHLANYSFSSLQDIPGTLRITDNLIGITAATQSHAPYFPELYLSQWFKQELQRDVTIWCFEKTGVRPLLENYQALVKHLSIDGILLIDGGVDSLMRGDESEVGTLIEDSISLAAVNELKNVRVRLSASLGFGAEQDLAHAYVLENIAALTKLDAFLGSCSLLRQMEVYQLYEAAVVAVQSNPRQDPSVINSSVVSAVQGFYGNHHLTLKTRGSKLWISPLMPIYWFFELPVVARRNMLLPALRWTDTISEAFREFMRMRGTTIQRKHMHIPLL